MPSLSAICLQLMPHKERPVVAQEETDAEVVVVVVVVCVGEGGCHSRRTSFLRSVMLAVLLKIAQQ